MDLYKRSEVQFGGAMTAEKGMFVSSGGLTGVLMQNFGLQYAQNVSRLYEIGKMGEVTNVYYVGGRAAGTMSVGHVIGPGVAMQEYYDNFSDVCKSNTNTIRVSAAPNVCATSRRAEVASYKMKYCVLVSIGLSVAAADFVINQQSQLMFSGLEYNAQTTF